jgi:hypothetical protein
MENGISHLTGLNRAQMGAFSHETPFFACFFPLCPKCPNRRPYRVPMLQRTIHLVCGARTVSNYFCLNMKKA